MVSIVRPKGTPSTIGIATPRSFFFSPEMRSSPFAIQRPPDKMNAVSCPPTVATAAMGTQEFLVGAVESVLRAGGDALADQAFDSSFGPALGALGLSRGRRLVRLPAVAPLLRCARHDQSPRTVGADVCRPQRGDIPRA